MYIYIYENLKTGRQFHAQSFRRRKGWRVIGVYLS